jgi:DNA-binding transcriptional ArsR family regulator
MDTITAIGMMSALAQPTRLRVVTALAKRFPKGLPAGELARLAETPQNTMSSHLAILARAGLVVATRTGRVVEYSADTKSLEALAGYVAALAPGR